MNEEIRELISEPDPKPVSPKKQKKASKRRVSPKVVVILVSLIIVAVGASYAAIKLNEWSKSWELHFQIPIQNFIRIEPRVTKVNHDFELVRHAQAKTVEETPVLK